MQDLSAFAEQNGIEVLYDEPMSEHTSMRVGGKAARFLNAPSGSLPALLTLLRESGEKFAVIGNGTNLLVPDEGYDGSVVRMIPEEPRLSGTEITCCAGTSLAYLATFAAKKDLSGLEFAHGIPGTVGGAVCMNAGAYGGEMSKVVKETAYFYGGEIKRLTGEEHLFGYRRSFFTEHPGAVVLESTFTLVPGDRKSIEEKMRELMKKRRASQPLNYPSAGSVFKRPEGYFAGKLIEDCGLKGYRIGGACVSEKHAGFIVNKGGASCRDVSELIAYIQKTGEERFGVRLEREVKIIGEV